MIQVCLVTQREISQTKYNTLNIWGSAQTKPFLKIEMNYFTHSNTQLINIRAKASKIIVNLDGSAFSKIYPLVTLIFNLLMRAKKVFISESRTIDDPHEDLVKSASHIHRKFNVNVRDLEIDVFLEKVPELISSLSNDYVAKIISMLFSDICFFPMRFVEFNSETVG